MATVVRRVAKAWRRPATCRHWAQGLGKEGGVRGGDHHDAGYSGTVGVRVWDKSANPRHHPSGKQRGIHTPGRMCLDQPWHMLWTCRLSGPPGTWSHAVGLLEGGLGRPVVLVAEVPRRQHCEPQLVRPQGPKKNVNLGGTRMEHFFPD